MAKTKKVRPLSFYQIHIDDNGDFHEKRITVKNGDFIQIVFNPKKKWDVTVDIEAQKILSAGGSVSIHS